MILRFAQPFGLELDHERQAVGRDVGVVDGHVVGRVGVHPAAALVDHAVVRFGRQPIGAAEHHVLEEMREPREAGLVLGAHAHPDLERDDGRRGIGQQQDGEAVVERRDLRPLRGVVHVGRCERGRHGREHAGEHHDPERGARRGESAGAAQRKIGSGHGGLA